MWQLEQAGVTSMCAQPDLKFYKLGTRMPIQSKTDIISDKKNKTDIIPKNNAKNKFCVL